MSYSESRVVGESKPSHQKHGHSKTWVLETVSEQIVETATRVQQQHAAKNSHPSGPAGPGNWVALFRTPDPNFVERTLFGVQQFEAGLRAAAAEKFDEAPYWRTIGSIVALSIALISLFFAVRYMKKFFAQM